MISRDLSPVGNMLPDGAGNVVLDSPFPRSSIKKREENDNRWHLFDALIDFDIMFAPFVVGLVGTCHGHGGCGRHPVYMAEVSLFTWNVRGQCVNLEVIVVMIILNDL